MSTNNLALVLQRMDQVDEAEMVFRKAIQAMQVPSGVQPQVMRKGNACHLCVLSR